MLIDGAQLNVISFAQYLETTGLNWDCCSVSALLFAQENQIAQGADHRLQPHQ